MRQARPTIVTIAKALSLSPSTVSRAFDDHSRISESVRLAVKKEAERQGYLPNRAASRLGRRELYVGVALGDGFAYGIYEALHGIEDAFRQFYDFKVTPMIRVFDAQDTSLAYAKRVMAAFDGCDGLIWCGFLGEHAEALLADYAKKRPLILLQSDLKGVEACAVSSQDEALAAKMAAEFLAYGLRNTAKKVVLFTGNRHFALHSHTASAFEKEAHEKGLSLSASLDMKDDAQILSQMVDRVLELYHPDGIFITSGISEPLCRAVQKRRERPLLLTFDTHPPLAPYITDGTIAATLYQNLHRQAYDALSMLIRFLVAGEIPPVRISPPLVLVLPSLYERYRCPDQVPSLFEPLKKI